jgi:uncharacterized membrane protein YsdA (DUF1294 family)
MIFLSALILLSLALYATLLGFGKATYPSAWRNREEALWVGRFSLLFGMLTLLDSFGITPHRISGWLEDILTAGGGVGVG